MKRITVLILSVFLFAFSAYASNVWVIDSTYDGHGDYVSDIIRQQDPDADVHTDYISHSPQINALDAANAIYNAVNQGADIINLSFGSTQYSRSLADAISYAQSQGVVIVAAAGNDGGATPNYPAALPGVVSVGAIEWNPYTGIYERAEYSNAGSIYAPGMVNPDVRGTSFSAPYVAGEIARAMDRTNSSAMQAKRIVLGRAQDNNGSVAPADAIVQNPNTNIPIQNPNTFMPPEQLLPDKDIWYDLLAAMIFTRIVMDNFFSDVFTAAANPFSDNFTSSGFSGNSYDRNFSSDFSPVIPYSGGIEFAPINAGVQDFSPWGL